MVLIIRTSGPSFLLFTKCIVIFFTGFKSVDYFTGVSIKTQFIVHLKISLKIY